MRSQMNIVTIAVLYLNQLIPSVCFLTSRSSFIDSKYSTNRSFLANMPTFLQRGKSSSESRNTDLIKQTNRVIPSVEDVMANRTDFEMAVMSAVVITIPLTVLITLAVSGDVGESIKSLFKEIGQDITSFSGGELSEDSMELLGDSIDIGANIMEAAVPSSVTDLISLALGESIAGGIGALATYLLQISLKTQDSIRNKLRFGKREEETSTRTTSRSQQQLITDAVADTDFFIVRAAAIPLASALGVPPILGVLLATIPSQLVKISAKQKEQRKLEDDYLQALLDQNQNYPTNPTLYGRSKSANTINTTIIPDISPGIANQVYFVEVFADITKWLSYDYLMKSFDGALHWTNGVPLGPGSESAVYGLLVTISSQIYADLLYKYSQYGSKVNREKALNRNFLDTARLYFNKGLSAAALFGVYETARVPISNAIGNFLSDGYDSCIGSEEFDLCLATYLENNPAAADPQAQVRSALVATTNLIERLSDGSLMDSNASMEAFIRSFAVQVYSLVTQNL